MHAQIIEHDHLPRRSIGPSSSPMYHSRSPVSIAPSIIQVTRGPRGERHHQVVFLPWLRGTEPVARWSCGAQP